MTVLELRDGGYVEVGTATPERPLAVATPYELEITLAPAA